MCNAWTNIPQITIASIEGVCIGGGLSLALSCDFRICSSDALLWVPEVDLGITYSWGSIPKLVAMVGPSKAKRMVLACEKINAKMSLEWGLCESIDEDPFNIALKMANDLAQKPSVPLQMAKESINRQYRIFNDFGLYEQDQVLLNLSSHETQNLLNNIKNKLKNKS